MNYAELHVRFCVDTYIFAFIVTDTSHGRDDLSFCVFQVGFLLLEREGD